MVEHELCKLGVRGSNPLASISSARALLKCHARARRARRAKCLVARDRYELRLGTLSSVGRVAQLVRARP